MGALRLWVHLFVDALGHCSGSTLKGVLLGQ